MENKKNSSTKRTRGAQPGNSNAVKHGFYSRNFKHLETSDLEVALLNGLDDEIAMLRVVIRRVFDYTHAEKQNLNTWTTGLETLGAACTRLAHLLRTQKLLGGQESDMSSALSQALKEVTKEFGYG
jgi:hypothetical protein